MIRDKIHSAIDTFKHYQRMLEDNESLLTAFAYAYGSKHGEDFFRSYLYAKQVFEQPLIELTVPHAVTTPKPRVNANISLDKHPQRSWHSSNPMPTPC